MNRTGGKKSAGAGVPGARAPRARIALEELLAGNRRFAKGKPQNPRRRPEDFRAVAAGQSPEAVIVACSDSRVPPELLFDTGVGDLFVVRVAGNVINAGPAVRGSVEFAVDQLAVPLIVLLGHSGCGAVQSAVEHIDRKDSLPGAIDELVELIKPAVARARGRRGSLVDNAIRANVQEGVRRLASQAPILSARVRAGLLRVVGAIYDLRSGVVSLVNEREKWPGRTRAGAARRLRS